MFAAATTTDWGALGGGLALAFITFMGVYTNWKNNKIAAAVLAADAKAEERAKLAETTANAVTKIVTNTDGTLSRLTAELQVAQEKIKGLEKLVVVVTTPPVTEAPKPTVAPAAG